MGIFRTKHQHHWKVTDAMFQPAPARGSSATNLSEETMLQLLYGFTILTQTCGECGWVSTSREAGRANLESHGIRWPAAAH